MTSVLYKKFKFIANTVVLEHLIIAEIVVLKDDQGSENNLVGILYRVTKCSII